MKSIICVVIFLTCLYNSICFSQNINDIHEDVYSAHANSAGVYLKDTVTGGYFTLFKNGVVESKGNLRERKNLFCRKSYYKDGIWEFYFESGVLKEKHEYTEGKLMWGVEYDEKGNVLEKW